MLNKYGVCKNRYKAIDKDNKRVEEKVGSQSNCLFNRYITNIAASVDAATKIISSAIIMTLMYGSGLYLYHGLPDRSTLFSYSLNF